MPCTGNPPGEAFLKKKFGSTCEMKDLLLTHVKVQKARVHWILTHIDIETLFYKDFCLLQVSSNHHHHTVINKVNICMWIRSYTAREQVYIYVVNIEGIELINSSSN